MAALHKTVWDFFIRELEFRKIKDKLLELMELSGYTLEGRNSKTLFDRFKTKVVLFLKSQTIDTKQLNHFFYSRPLITICW